ncbi:MAG: DsbA family protein [Candidatus Nanohaloarchaea archaeon]
MVDCKYCEEEFDSEREMHIHWGEEHEDELNSHDEEKVKKAERKKEEEKQKKMSRRKKLAGQGLALGGALVLVAVLGYQALGAFGGSTGSGNAEFELKGEPMLGNPGANVTVVEFGDYKCPFCRDFEANHFQRLEKNYIEKGKVKFYFMNYAFLGQSSTRAAVAAECVLRQNESQFWKFHKAIYQNQGPESQDWATQSVLMNIARQNTQGLDYQKLRSCISNRKTINEVQSDRSQGAENGVSGTPKIFVNGRKLPGYEYSTIKAAIEQELR